MSAAGPGHVAIRATESGCLVIADISGYTSYLGSAELDHAQDVLEDLTEIVVRALAPPMKLSKLEGDAVFVHLPGSRVDASMLLDTIDAAYFAFRRRQDAIDRATECDCNACVLIPRLDLKFVAHHGAFGRQHVAGSEELSGPDVILVHRLLKNGVAEVVGHAGYAFYTDAVVGTRVTETTAPGSGLGQRVLLGIVGRMMTGELARGEVAFRSAVTAALATSDATAPLGPGRT